MAQGAFGPIRGDRYHRYAQDILASGRHLLELINDVLDLSSIEAGRANIQLEHVSAAAVARAWSAARSRRRSASVCAPPSAARSPPPVRADRRGMNQILLNLLSNAVKFTPPARGRRRCRARPDLDGPTSWRPDGADPHLAITRSLASDARQMEIESALRVGTTPATCRPDRSASRPRA